MNVTSTADRAAPPKAQPTPPLGELERRALLRQEKAIQILQEATSESATLLMLSALFAVAQNEGSTVSDLTKKLGAKLSTTSRNLLSLGPMNRKRGDGFELVETRKDPKDMRRKRYYLTPKGNSVLRQIVREVG
jgi:DNA-binding MarR family transcriptional regulator